VIVLTKSPACANDAATYRAALRRNKVRMSSVIHDRRRRQRQHQNDTGKLEAV
jgi:hypothetical protein